MARDPNIDSKHKEGRNFFFLLNSDIFSFAKTSSLICIKNFNDVLVVLFAFIHIVFLYTRHFFFEKKSFIK